MGKWNLGAIVAATLVALLYTPGLARANSLRISSYEMNDSGGSVQLESNAPIGVPWVRLDGHSAKIWFPDVTEIARFDHARDANEAIRMVQLRLAAADSAVLRFDLGTGRTLSQDDVQVTRNGASATIKLRAKPAPSAAPQPAAAAIAASAAASAPNSPPSAAVSKEPAALRPAAASQPPPQAAPTPVAAAPAPAKPLNLATPDDAAAKPGPSPSQPKADSQPASKEGADARGVGLATAPGTNLGVLIAISLLLLAVYVALRLYGKKRVQFAPDIQIVSSRRVGHRQELMVVRALGADHLLVCSPGKIERVTSVPTPVLPESEPEPMLSLSLAPAAQTPAAASAEEASSSSSQAGGLGIVSMLSRRSKLRRLLDALEQGDAPAPNAEAAPVAPPVPSPAAPPRSTARPTFGPELLHAIHSHKLTSLSALPQIAPLAARESDAVAGIQRLRERGAN